MYQYVNGNSHPAVMVNDHVMRSRNDICGIDLTNSYDINKTKNVASRENGHLSCFFCNFNKPIAY